MRKGKKGDLLELSSGVVGELLQAVRSAIWNDPEVVEGQGRSTEQGRGHIGLLGVAAVIELLDEALADGADRLAVLRAAGGQVYNARCRSDSKTTAIVQRLRGTGREDLAHAILVMLILERAGDVVGRDSAVVTEGSFEVVLVVPRAARQAVHLTGTERPLVQKELRTKRLHSGR